MPYFCLICKRDNLYKNKSLRSEEDFSERSEEKSDEDLCDFDLENCPFYQSFNPKF